MLTACYPLIILLNRLEEGLAGAKKIRNSITHAERFYENEVCHIGLIEHSLSERIVDDENGFLRADLHGDIEAYRDKKKRLLEANNKALIPILGQFLDELEIIYKEQIVSSKEIQGDSAGAKSLQK